VIDPNLLTSKEARFVDKLKITFNLANMFDKRKDSNTREDNELVQTIRKTSRDRSKKVNIKSSKAKSME